MLEGNRDCLSPPSRRPRRLMLLLTLAATVAAACAGSVLPVRPATTRPIAGEPASSSVRAARFQTWLGSGMNVEPHVFVETAPGAPTVRRPTPADARTRPDKELFWVSADAADQLAGHDFDPAQILPKGEAMGMTLREWLAGRGEARFTCSDTNTASVLVTFSGLRPHGVYTLLDMRPGADRMIVRALGAVEDGQSLVVADADSDAAARVDLSFCPAALAETMEMGLAFHSHFWPEAPAEYVPGEHDAIQLLATLNDATPPALQGPIP
jgi:hypothetical protein